MAIDVAQVDHSLVLHCVFEHRLHSIRALHRVGRHSNALTQLGQGNAPCVIEGIGQLADGTGRGVIVRRTPGPVEGHEKTNDLSFVEHHRASPASFERSCSAPSTHC